MTMPPLPSPLWQGGFGYYYTDDQMKAYGAACVAAEREAIAQMLDEEQRRDRWSNHAGVFARMVRERSKT